MNHVVFCTRNGARTLPAMLASLREVRGIRDSWRILVVDNGCRDESRHLLAQAAHDLPIRVIEGVDGGKNSGLNRALDTLAPSLADDELIVFSDDDIIAEPGWLEAFLCGAAAHPQASMFGGAITPRWPSPPPAWLQGLDGAFDALYARTHPVRGLCEAHHLYGPNMAMRASLVIAGARFDPRIGPTASVAYRMGSETELVQRLERSGHRAAMLQEACVHHQVRPEQMTEAFVLARARRHGLGQGVLAARTRAGSAPLPPASRVAALVASEVKSVMRLLPGLRRKRVKTWYGREWLRGYCQGYLAQRAEARRADGGAVAAGERISAAR